MSGSPRGDEFIAATFCVTKSARQQILQGIWTAHCSCKGPSAVSAKSLCRYAKTCIRKSEPDRSLVRPDWTTLELSGLFQLPTKFATNTLCDSEATADMH